MSRADLVPKRFWPMRNVYVAVSTTANEDALASLQAAIDRTESAFIDGMKADLFDPNAQRPKPTLWQRIKRRLGL